MLITTIITILASIAAIATTLAITQARSIKDANNLILTLKQENKKFKSLAYFDLLTGAQSPHTLKNEKNNAISLLNRNYSNYGPIALLYCDLDGFKEVNDTYGHAVGDEALKLFVKILQNHLRGSDKLIRKGGDEFIIFLYKTNIEDAAIVVEHLKSSILKDGKISAEGNTIQLHASFGISELEKGTPFEESLHEADQKMYLAKEGYKESKKAA